MEILQEVWSVRLDLLQGLWLTVLISLSAIMLGTLLGTAVGIVLTYGSWLMRLPARIYADFVRGTPVLVLILAAFYILAVVGIDLTAVQAGIFALTLFCGSHVGEIVRGALQAIPRGQTDAAKSIGLTFGQTFVHVLLPQAIRQILPTWITAATEIVKASTLLSVIGVSELLLTTQEIISRNFMNLEFYLVAGIIYFFIDFGIERIGKAVDRRMRVG
ncbi:MAG: amino acid ABC transporter permease [Azospirillaceae bacterium]